MKHYFLFFTTLCAFLLFSCNGNGPRSEQYAQNKQELLRISNKAMQHIPITDETGIDSLYEFFKKHGTEDDAYVAAFYKAIFLQQTGDKESAFNLLIESYGQRPATETSTSRSTSMKILDNFLVQYIWDKDAENLTRWITEAERSEVYEEEVYYSLYNRKASYFDLIEKTDSSHHYMNLAYENMVQYPDWDENKSMILAGMAGWYAQRGEHEEFMKLYELLNKHPYHGKNNATDFYAGLYYNQIGQRDSAETCFRRATKASGEVARHAYIQLAIMARNTGQHDSVFAYLQGVASTSDSVILKQQAEATQKFEAAYKISKHENKIAHQKIIILSLIVLLLGMTLLFFFGWFVVIEFRRRIRIRTEELEREKKIREQLQQQLQRVLDAERDSSLEEHEDKVRRLDKKVSAIRANLVKPSKNINDVEKTELSQLFIEAFPLFVKRIMDIYPRFKADDIVICILALNDFGQTEMGHILQKERQQISNIIRRISKNLTGESVGRMEDFKAMLETYLS